MMTESIHDNNFKDSVKEGLTFVDFWAPWCGPCRMLSPVIDSLSEKYKGKINIVKINIDENKEVASKYGIMSIPTMVLFKDGKAVEKVSGFHPLEALDSYLQGKL